MWRDFGLLLRLRVRAWWNAVGEASPARRWVGGLLSLGSLIVFVLILGAYAAFLGGVRELQGAAAQAAVIERTVFFLFLFLLAGAVPFVSGVLLAPGDLPLLSATPVRPAAVVVARLLDAVLVSSGQFVVIGVPLLVASGWAQFGASLPGWLAFLLLLILFLALPPLIVAALLLLLARLAGVRRVKVAVAIASILLSLALCLLTVSELSRRAAGSVRNGTENAGITSLLTKEDIDSGERPESLWMPSTQVSETLQRLGSSQLAEGLLPLGELLAMTLGIGALASWLGGPILIGESLLEGDSLGAGRAGRRSRLDIALSLLPFLGQQSRALIAKDMRYIVRDLVLLSQIGIPFILYFVPFVIGQAQGGGRNADDSLLVWLSLGIIAMIAYMVTSILSLSSIGLEGRGFWLVLAAPITSGTFVRAKWLAATGASIVLTAPLLVVSCAVYRVAAEWTLYGLLALSIVCGALCGFGVGLSGLFPRFVYENPAHRASLTALIGGFIGATLYLILAGGALGAAFLFAPQWPERATLIYAGGIGVFLILSLLMTILPLGMAIARLDGYVWEE